ncbi:MAG: (Fe-S)-binding protein, partial [Bryobacteraceae bacterium]
YVGMAGAVEMCSGVGACRKKLAGSMCPSYMATREEKDSTRGRANALRLAMSGRLGDAGLGGEAVREVLDLCLECRACKSECPVGVDMARYKSEFLADYWSRNGTPLRARALGNIRGLAKGGSRFAPLSNWAAGMFSPPWFDSRRPIPAWKRQTFERWLAANPKKNGAVTIFNDTFTNYYEPEIGIAAVEVLERAGCSAAVATPGCCGRPMISQGLLAGAREHASKLVDALFPIASRGEKILFLEPSCLSAVKEDAPSLLRGDAQKRARAVADACILFEEFATQLELPLSEGPKKILLHGHCHQKSMGLLGATASLLAKIPSARIVDPDAGCCGMAGSFGYVREHYEISVAIANRRLIPAVKAMQPDEAIVAPGTSCRRQIADLTGVVADHPAVLIRKLLS